MPVEIVSCLYITTYQLCFPISLLIGEPCILQSLPWPQRGGCRASVLHRLTFHPRRRLMCEYQVLPTGAACRFAGSAEALGEARRRPPIATTEIVV